MQKLLCIESFLIGVRLLWVRVLCCVLAGRLPTVSRLNMNREQGRLDSQSVSQSVNINDTTINPTQHLLLQPVNIYISLCRGEISGSPTLHVSPPVKRCSQAYLETKPRYKFCRPTSDLSLLTSDLWPGPVSVVPALPQTIRIFGGEKVFLIYIDRIDVRGKSSSADQLVMERGELGL